MREFLRSMEMYYPIDKDRAERIINNYRRGMLLEIEAMKNLVNLTEEAREAMIEEYEKECAID